MDDAEFYDSDNVDEDLEAKLYSFVYFDQEEIRVPSPQTDSSKLDSSCQEPTDTNLAQDPALRTPLPTATSRDVGTPFSWSFPPGIEKGVTSLSSVADAIYLTLTGELPPSVRELHVMKSGRTPRNNKPIASTKQLLSFDDDINVTPNRSQETGNNAHLSDTSSMVSSSKSEENVSFTVSSNSESDDSDHLDSSEVDVPDIILGVSDPSKGDFIANGDSASVIADMLRNTSSEPENWYLDVGDRIPLSVRNRRYCDNYQNDSCRICFAKGHLAFECWRKGPVCFLCGRDGHLGYKCPNKYCSVCLSPGHRNSNCPQRNRMEATICKRCQQPGHTSNLCSELWRQYRATTHHGKPVILKQTSPRRKSCCNCGRQGHTSNDCRCPPFSGASLVKTSIRVYDKHNVYAQRRAVDPSRTLKKVGRRMPRHSQRHENGSSVLIAGKRSSTSELEHICFKKKPKIVKRNLTKTKRQDDTHGLSKLEVKKRRRLEKAERRVERKLFEQVLHQAGSTRKVRKASLQSLSGFDEPEYCPFNSSLKFRHSLPPKLCGQTR
uniref:Zinc finger CCHC domain-containing protein 7 n=1 Tax=Mesocestoides corti TaxID=53468 RepID=A0A5K3EM88_MESCO